MSWLVGALVIFAVGYSATQAGKRRFVDAMQRDGFTPAEIKRAMRHHSRGDTARMTAYCREIVERNAVLDGPVISDGRDWTKANAYERELV